MSPTFSRNVESNSRIRGSPIEGFIDVHCHFLPGVDDGCKDLAETIECIGLLKQAGFVGSICTPHVGIARYHANNPESIAQRTSRLIDDLQSQGVDYQLWDGGEIRIAKHPSDLLDHDQTPRLAESRCMLFDWWQRSWPDFLDEYFETLIDSGFQPILAHPERLPLDENLFQRVIDRLLDNGILLQGNLKSFAPESEERVAKRAKRLLKENRYHIIASDSHGPRSIPSRLAGLKSLRELIDETTLETLLSERPRQLIAAKLVR